MAILYISLIIDLAFVFNRFFGLFLGLQQYNATFNNISIYRGGQFYWWRRPAYPVKHVKK
jgi:hypothetical protein